MKIWTKKPNFAMQSRYFSFHKTCNNVTKFQAIFIINYLAGENEENKIINAEEITKHGKCLWGVSKHKWERKPALFQNVLKFCIFLPKPILPFLPFFVVFEKSCTCSYFLEYVLAAMVNWEKYVTSILFWLLPLQSSRSDGTTMGSTMQQCNDATLIKTTIKHTLGKQT